MPFIGDCLRTIHAQEVVPSCASSFAISKQRRDEDRLRASYHPILSKREKYMAVPASQRDAAIGPYRTIRHLGSGAMGEVFLAHDDDLGRDIAVKLLPAHLAES